MTPVPIIGITCTVITLVLVVLQLTARGGRWSASREASADSLAKDVIRLEANLGKHEAELRQARDVWHERMRDLQKQVEATYARNGEFILLRQSVDKLGDKFDVMHGQLDELKTALIQTGRVDDRRQP